VRTVATEINRRPRTTTRGYVLVEVIVSLVVFSIGMVSVMRTFSVAIHARALAQDYTIATLLCQRLLDESRVMVNPQGGRGREKGRFGTRFEWVRETAVARGPAEQQERQRRQQAPRRGALRNERRRGSLNRQRSRNSQRAIALRENTLLETTVEVSWMRKGAKHAVTVQAKIPATVNEGSSRNASAQGFHTDRDSRRNDDILRRDDRGLRRL